MAELRYPRVLLKLSGEALAGDRGFGFDFDTIRGFAQQVKAISELGAQVGLVIGGGNIVRGSQISKMGIDRVSADYMGMLGTVINALAFQDVLEREGLDTRVMTAIRMEEIASRTSGAEPSGTSRRGAVSSSRRAPAICTSRPTPPRCCGPSR